MLRAHWDSSFKSRYGCVLHQKCRDSRCHFFRGVVADDKRGVCVLQQWFRADSAVSMAVSLAEKARRRFVSRGADRSSGYNWSSVHSRDIDHAVFFCVWYMRVVKGGEFAPVLFWQIYRGFWAFIMRVSNLNSSI